MCDDKDNLYMATMDGILIVSAAKEKLALISLPEIPSNLTWGGPENSILYVTASSSVYTIENLWTEIKL